MIIAVRSVWYVLCAEVHEVALPAARGPGVRRGGAGQPGLLLLLLLLLGLFLLWSKCCYCYGYYNHLYDYHPIKLWLWLLLLLLLLLITSITFIINGARAAQRVRRGGASRGGWGRALANCFGCVFPRWNKQIESWRNIVLFLFSTWKCTSAICCQALLSSALHGARAAQRGGRTGTLNIGKFDSSDVCRVQC